MPNAESDASTVNEGDYANMRVRVARANSEQALIEFMSMEGPYSLRVPLSELTRIIPPRGTKADYLLDGSPESVALVREARGLPPLTGDIPPDETECHRQTAVASGIPWVGRMTR